MSDGVVEISSPAIPRLKQATCGVSSTGDGVFLLVAAAVYRRLTFGSGASGSQINFFKSNFCSVRGRLPSVSQDLRPHLQVPGLPPGKYVVNDSSTR